MTGPSQGIEPMTAAELERIATQCERSQCQHAADYRRAAARIRELEAHARLGSLVAAIREHPMADEKLPVASYVVDVQCFPVRRDFFDLTEEGFAAMRDALDSLLPKEPEVVTGPSGNRWRVKDGQVEGRVVRGFAAKEEWAVFTTIPAEDAPVVAKLMENSTHD